MTSSIPDGWYDIADALFGEIEACLSEDELALFHVASICPRRGQLHIVLEGNYTEEIGLLVDGLAALSSLICQECGGQDALFRHPAVNLTLCDFCEHERGVRIRRSRSMPNR
ncbi:MAG: hypothetical protein ACJ8HI_22245 [Massilia sp.]